MTRTLLLIALPGLFACTETIAPRNDAPKPPFTDIYASQPQNADPGACWGRLTAQTDPPPKDPTATETTRAETWFQTPCPGDLTPRFVASIQRALQARRLYNGSIDGQMSPETRTAILKYQALHGLETSILSVPAARKLGLWTVERPPTES